MLKAYCLRQDSVGFAAATREYDNICGPIVPNLQIWADKERVSLQAVSRETTLEAGALSVDVCANHVCGKLSR